MNRFLEIFETALKNKNQTVTGEDVNEVLSKLKDEAMTPGSLTSGDSSLVPLPDDEVSEDSTTGSVAGFNSGAFQPQKDGRKTVIAKMIADALEKACAFGNDEMTFDSLEEFRTTFAEKRRLKNYPRRKERFGRDPLGTQGLKPDSLEEEAESDQTPIDPVELMAAIEMLKASRKLPKDENGALAAPHATGRIAIGKIVS